jgi:predicted TIM-barrel fold metal-dependent hydrolase
MARRVNEYTADLVAKRPDRFGNFATLSLPDVDGALSELEHALGTLCADGVILLGSSSAGQFCLCWCEQKMVSQFIQDGLHE